MAARHRVMILASIFAAACTLLVVGAFAGEARAGPEPGRLLACEACHSVEACQALVDRLMRRFRGHAGARRTVVFRADGTRGYCDGFTAGVIRCPRSWLDTDILTNKLLFHELNHKLRRKKLVRGASGRCSGGCGSSELQASLLEAYYFPDRCTGGSYTFTDSNGIARQPADVLRVLLASPAISEKALWAYTTGRRDTLAPYMRRFGLSRTRELFESQSYW